MAERGDEDIVEAVVVVIADGNAHAKHFNGEASFLRDVSECAVVIVVIEGQRGAMAFLAGPVFSVDQEDVLPTVVVVIEESDAGAHCFGQPFFTGGGVVVSEVDSG